MSVGLCFSFLSFWGYFQVPTVSSGGSNPHVYIPVMASLSTALGHTSCPCGLSDGHEWPSCVAKGFVVGPLKELESHSDRCY